MDTRAIETMIDRLGPRQGPDTELRELLAAVADAHGREAGDEDLDRAERFVHGYIDQVPYMIKVASISASSVGLEAEMASVLETAEAERILAEQPDYLLIDHESGDQVVMPAVELAKYLQSPAHSPESAAIDLMAIPGKRLEVAQIELQASLQEAWALFQERRAEALVVQRMTAPGIRRVYGIITPETVEKSYR